MRKNISLLLLFLSCHVYAQTGDVRAILRQLKDAQSKNVLVAAHRGDWRNAPENSILAVTNAVAMGVDIVEIDIKKTKDGHLVVMHDETVDRTTDGKGYVSDYTLEAIRKLHLRNGIDRPTRHMVPTLEEAMLAVKGKAMINLDKCYSYMREAYAVLVKTGTVDHALFTGFKKADDVRKEYGDVIDKVLYMPVVSLDAPDTEATIHDFQHKLKPAVLQYVFTQDTTRVFQKSDAVRRNGSAIWINSLWASLNAGHDDDLSETDLENSFGWIIRSGANIIQTDRPKELLEYLKSKGLRNK